MTDAHLPASGRAWKLPPKCSGERRARPGNSPPHHPLTRAHGVEALLCPSVLRLHLPERGGAGTPTPRTVLLDRRPVRAPRHTPSAGLRRSAAPPPHRQVPCPRSPAAFSRARKVACESRRRRWADLPGSRCVPGSLSARDAARTRGEGTPPTEDRGSLGETEPKGAGPKPASARRARKFIVCLGRRRRRCRHRAGSAAGSEAARSLRRPELPTPSPGRRRRCPAGTRRGAGASRPRPDSRRSSSPPPLRQTPNLYLRNPSPTRETLRLGLRGSAPSPAPRALHPGSVNLTPRAQGGKVWE